MTIATTIATTTARLAYCSNCTYTTNHLTMIDKKYPLCNKQIMKCKTITLNGTIMQNNETEFKQTTIKDSEK